jgi:hypothetical protein
MKPALIHANPGAFIFLRTAHSRIPKVLIEHWYEKGHEDKQRQNCDWKTGWLDYRIFATFFLFAFLLKENLGNLMIRKI